MYKLITVIIRLTSAWKSLYILKWEHARGPDFKSHFARLNKTPEQHFMALIT